MMIVTRGDRFGSPVHMTAQPRARGRAESVRGLARPTVDAADRFGYAIGQANLPTYATVADVLEKKNGSGLRLAGWTIARMIMIAPPMMLVGVPAAVAFKGAAISSGLISLFTMIRIHNAAAAQGVHS